MEQGSLFCIKKNLVFFLLIKILKTKGQTRSILVQNNRTVVILFIIVNIRQDSKITDQNRKKPQEIISKFRSWAKKGWGWGEQNFLNTVEKRVQLCELAYLALNKSHDY